jgi:hypothetical protein
MWGRRRFLSTTALSGLGLLFSVGAARALRVDDGPAGPAGQAAACHSAAFHDQLLAEIQGLIEGQALSADDKAKILAAATCPYCGCALGRS